jgi:uncharacterized membrane protein YgcG
MASRGRKINLRLISYLFAAFELRRGRPQGAAEEWPKGLPESSGYYPFLSVDPDYINYVAQDNVEARDSINLHLSYMASLGLIQPIKQENRWSDRPLDRWRLSNSEELDMQIQERRAANDTRLQNHPAVLEPANASASGDGRSKDSDGNGNGNGGDSGGRGPGGPGDRRGGPGGPGDGPGGIRQVLSHPVLFTLPSDEFEDVVGRLFDGAGAL